MNNWKFTTIKSKCSIEALKEQDMAGLKHKKKKRQRNRTY